MEFRRLVRGGGSRTKVDTLSSRKRWTRHRGHDGRDSAQVRIWLCALPRRHVHISPQPRGRMHRADLVRCRTVHLSRLEHRGQDVPPVSRGDVPKHRPAPRAPVCPPTNSHLSSWSATLRWWAKSPSRVRGLPREHFHAGPQCGDHMCPAALVRSWRAHLAGFQDRRESMQRVWILRVPIPRQASLA